MIEDVDLYNCGGPIFIRLGNRGRDYSTSIKQVYAVDAKPEGGEIGSIKNITFRNMTARLTGRMDPPTEGMMFTGLPDHYIENVTLENIDFSYTGFGETGAADNVIAEDEARYPEQLFFGVLPSYGLYARHIKGLNMSNVKFSLRAEDDRQAIVLDDVKDSSLTKITLDSYLPKSEAVKVLNSTNIKLKGIK